VAVTFTIKVYVQAEAGSGSVVSTVFPLTVSSVVIDANPN